MCLLTVFPEHIEPDVGALLLGAENNPDGHGFAIADPAHRRMIVGRGLDPFKVIDRFLELREKHPAGPALFHSRIGTAGIVDESNCHPFYVGGDRRTVIAHNGILPRKAQPGWRDERSDTRLLAEVFLPKGRFGTIRTHGGRNHLARWMGPGNKIAILTIDPRYDSNLYILNEAEGEWYRGIWYSNDSYRVTWARYTVGGKSRRFESDDDWRHPDTCSTIVGNRPAHLGREDCAFCGSYGTVTAATICSVCLSCNECGEFETDCFCWIPPQDRRNGLTPAQQELLEEWEAEYYDEQSRAARGEIALYEPEA